jgi:hypothetical protein
MARAVEYDDETTMSKVREEHTPEDRLNQIMVDLHSGAESLEAEARDYEDRMLLCRARAAGLRTATEGVRAALERFREDMAKRQEFMASRDGEDLPGRNVVNPREASAERAQGRY